MASNSQIQVKGTVTFSRLVKPGTNNASFAPSYSISLADPEFMGTDQAAIESLNLRTKQPTPDHPHKLLTLNLPDKNRDGSANKIHYWDNATKAEVPVTQDIASGQIVIAIVSVYPSQSAATAKYHNYAARLDGVLFADVKNTKWYAGSSDVLPGFKPLATQTPQSAPAQPAANADPFGTPTNAQSAPQNTAAPTQNPAAAPAQSVSNVDPFATQATPTQSADPFASQAGNSNVADPFGGQAETGQASADPFGNTASMPDPFASNAR